MVEELGEENQNNHNSDQINQNGCEELEIKAENLKNEGNLAYRNGNFIEAVEFYTKSLEICPNNPSVYGNRAAAYLILKKYKESLNDSMRAISLDPEYVKGYLREGKANFLLGDISKAIASLEKAKSIDSSNPSVEEDLIKYKAVKSFSDEASLSYDKGDFRKVVYLMDRCLNHLNDCHKFLLMKAECLALLGRYQEAQEIANEIVIKDQKNSDALYVRGMCLYYQGNSEVAFQHFQRVLQYEPDHQKAKDFYKSSKKLHTKKEQGNIEFKAGNWKNAYSLYSECLDIDSKNKSINSILYFNRANASFKMNNIDACIDDCTKAIEIDHGYLKAYLRRAKCYMETENFEAAVKDYNQAYKLDKSNKENYRLMKDAEFQLKKSLRKDFYKILGVNKNATDDEIKKAYRKSALMHHPDRFPDATEEIKKQEELKFKEIGEAYTVLSDPKKKARYDNGQDLEDYGMNDDQVDPNAIFKAFFGNFNGNRPRNGFSGFEFSFG